MQSASAFRKGLEYAGDQLDSNQLIQNIVTNHRDSLEAWAASGLNHIGRQSQVLLNYIDGLSYFPDIVLNSSSGSSSYKIQVKPDTPLSEPKKTKEAITTSEILVIPNPVSGEAEIRYNLDESWEQANLRIFSVTGISYFEKDVLGPIGSRKIFTFDWPNGIYFVVFKNDSGSTKTARFIVSH